ncbi:MAG: iron hydrogenase [Candidatus Moranbacteria bacterium]|nr:iron hydrogenase [Candidatus Moranbacteria bacterium]
MIRESSEVEAISFDRAGTTDLFRFAFLLALALTSSLVFSQPVTGSFVNAALFLSAAFFGMRKESYLLATVPSLVAISTGQLPIVFASMVPFIMAGNLLLVFLADLGFRRNWSFPAVAALSAIAKSALLLAVGLSFSVTLFRGLPIAAKVPTMFGWLQLATALAGAVVAYPILRLAKGVFRED